MFAGRQFQLVHALRWSYPVIAWSGGWAGVVTAAHLFAGPEVGELIQIPALPVGVLGTAVAFYLGFKGNAAYERTWEARKIWGGIVNSSRTWGAFVVSMVSDRHVDGDPDGPVADVHRELVYRHVAWLQALRTQLLRRKPWEHDETWNNTYREHFGTDQTSPEILRERVAPLVPANELDGLMAQRNQATQLIRRQAQRLMELLEEGRIEDFRHMQLSNLLEEFYTLQGKAERIKNFPLPRQYATANHWFVKIFIGLLPFALLSAFHVDGLPHAYVWLTVPATALVGWVFGLWDMVVDYSENPFEGLINDIPMAALSRTIEIDLREMLGETELPPPVTPVDGNALF